MTKIEWADESWNPITGCSHAGSPGCDNCYAGRMAKRLAGRFGYPESPHEFDVTFHPDKLELPLRWRKPRVVFVCSMGDLFHEDVLGIQLDLIHDVMESASRHIFLILTKRPEQMGEYWDWLKRGGYADISNVWLGVSVENQDQMWRVEELLKIPAAKHFVSFEPLLGPIHVGRHLPDLDGVIVGGESGRGARPMHPDWARSIRDQCLLAGVPFTFKQWGRWKPMRLKRGQWKPALSEMLITKDGKECHWPDGWELWSVGKKAAGRELDGEVWDQFPWEVL